MKYFICSDLHGEFNGLMEAIKTNGYDENNPEHKLVVAGDIFDRGSDSVKIYEYLKRLTDENKAIVLAGNHHPMFIGFLHKLNEHFNFTRNGMWATVDDFLHQTRSWEMYIISRYNDEEQKKMTDDEWYDAWMEFTNISADEINAEYPELLGWLENLPDYLELKNSIITHGMIDCNGLDWHIPRRGWDTCHWATPQDAAFLKNTTGKHIYLGHIDSDTIRETLGLPKDNYSLFTRDEGDVTYLDSCTILTHRVNMVVIEDEPLEIA